MSPTSPNRWLPALVLTAGCALLVPSQRQRAVPLAAPLSDLPPTMLGFGSRDVPIPEDEQRLAGMSNYLLRVYSDSANQAAFQVYVGYYEAQNQGRSIHSPKNCLPGAGWEPLSAGMTVLQSTTGRYRVNRYVLANGDQTALVYYWYQGRGRVQASEYTVKWDLLRDKAIWGRSEEALVRILVPIPAGRVAAADSLASRLGASLVDEVQKHLPGFPGRSMVGD